MGIRYRDVPLSALSTVKRHLSSVLRTRAGRLSENWDFPASVGSFAENSFEKIYTVFSQVSSRRRLFNGYLDQIIVSYGYTIISRFKAHSYLGSHGRLVDKNLVKGF